MRDLHPGMLEARIFELEQNGGGGGSTDYENLENKPKIENVELVGNLTFEDLGIASAEDLGQTNEDLLEVQQIANQNYADIGTINSKLGVVPDDESIEEQINNIKDNLSKKDFEESIDIKNYTSSNFTVPDDGYITAQIAYQEAVNTYIYVLVNGVQAMQLILYSKEGNNAQSLFVKKGMLIRNSNNIATQYSHLYYRKLV